MIATKAIALATLLFAGVKALEVSTPDSVAQCGDIPFTVSGATGAYHFSVVPAENSCESDALFESDALYDGSYTWKASLKSGTQVMVVVDDDSGAEAWSGAFTIADGDAACLTAVTSSSSAAAPTSTHAATSSSKPTSTSKTSLFINNIRPTGTIGLDDTPANAGDGDNGPATGAAFSNAQASLFTVLAAMGAVALAL